MQEAHGELMLNIPVWATMDDVTVSINRDILYGHMFSFILDKYLGVEFAGSHRNFMFNHLSKNQAILQNG